MTPKRKEALQYFHDQGEIMCSLAWDVMPCTMRMVSMMLTDLQLDGKPKRGVYYYTLTNKGRRDLHEATK